MKDQNPFKQKLYHYTLPVKEDMWKQVEASLPVPKRRLPFLWISIAGFVLLGASAIGLTMRHKPLFQNKQQEINSLQEFNAANTTHQPDNETASSFKENTTQNLSTKETTELNASAANLKNTFKHQSSIRKTAPDQITRTDQQSDVNAEVSIGKTRKSTRIAEVQMLNTNLVTRAAERSEMSSIKPDPSCYKFRGKNGKNVLSFDIFAAPGIAPRTFEATEGGTSPYATARNQTENGQYAWSAGARLNLNLQQGFAVRLGILYEQVGDKFNYTDASATQSTTQIDSFFAADGTFLRADTNRILIFGKLIKKIHNRYTHLDIPLLLSYELPMGRSTLMINAGPVLNLTSGQKGQILDPTLNPVHITPGEPDELKAYKTNVGLSIYVGAGALFPLTDNISVLVEPRLLYRINHLTLDTYPLKEHRSFAGLNMGIRYHFN